MRFNKFIYSNVKYSWKTYLLTVIKGKRLNVRSERKKYKERLKMELLQVVLLLPINIELKLGKLINRIARLL